MPLLQEMVQILRKHLGSKRNRLPRAQEAALGILGVLTKLKQCYLYDIGDPDPQALAKAVKALVRLIKRHVSIDAQVCVLVLNQLPDTEEEDLGIVSDGEEAYAMGVFVVDLVLVNLDLEDYVFVDATPQQSGTQKFDLVSTENHRLIAECWSVVTSCINAQAQVDNELCSVVSVPGKLTWPSVTIFGLLLGYPVAYYSAMNESNGLGGRDLHLHQLAVECSTELCNKESVLDITSFTVPCDMDDASQHKVLKSIEQWRARSTPRSLAHMFQSITYSSSRVCYPVVSF